jgi:hypothetical protein
MVGDGVAKEFRAERGDHAGVIDGEILKEIGAGERPRR